MIRTTRVCAGEYVVRETTDIRPSREVRVTKVYYPGDGTYWIAAAQWDSHRYTDPLMTKRDAVHNAKLMLTSDHTSKGN